MKHKFLHVISYLFLLLIIVDVNSQTKPDNFELNSIEIEAASDSLQSKSFDELKSDFYKNQQDSSLSKKIARYYIIKAKKIRDTAKIASGYYLISKTNNDSIAEKYLDTIISITKNIKANKYPARAYLMKGVFHARTGNYNLALKNYLVAQKYAALKSDEFQLIAIKHNIGLLKRLSESEREALVVFKKNLLFFSQNELIEENLRTYLNTIFAISDSYLRLKEPDSAAFYIDIGLSRSINFERQNFYSNFLLLDGVKSRMRGNYISALDTLLKAQKRMASLDLEDDNKRITDLQIAKVLLKLGRNNEALKYLQNLESAITANNFSPNERDTFNLLIDYYKSKGDDKNQLQTLNKLIRLDSLFNSKNKHIGRNIIKKFDTKLLIDEREGLISNLKSQKSFYHKGIIFLVVLSVFLIFMMFSYRKKQRDYKSRFEQIINKQKGASVKKETCILHNDNKLDLPEDLIANILNGLENFENRNGFLSSDIKMNTIAQQLETNGAYLSKVVNNYKGKNFTNYINDLRVGYCVDKLTTDSIFRKYSIKAIGEDVGFSSTQSFTRAFYKKTGLQPSYFLKNLNIN